MVESLIGCRDLARNAKIQQHSYQTFGILDTMYNMNNSLLTVPGGSIGGGTCSENNATTTGVTPRTPEILNSLMAMTNPFDMTRGPYPKVASSPPSDTTSNSNSPPSVQATRSQLIKEGLKLTIQTKRRAHCSESSSPPNDGLSTLSTHSKSDDNNMDLERSENSNEGLTPEDEERRRRRRERNKIAATKCRLKKRERTVNLVQESEILETQNHDLKSQIKELENQRKKLFDMLSGHRTNCSKQTYTTSTPSTSSSFQEPYHHRCSTSSNLIESTSGYGSFSSLPSTSYHKISCESTTVAYHRNSAGNSGSSTSIYESGSYQRTTYHQQQQQQQQHGNNNTNLYQQPDQMYMRNSGSDSTVYTTLSSGTSRSTGNTSPIMFLGSPSTPQYNRPSSLGLNTTSSSDYESNTELVDSPSIPPSGYHHFDEDTAGIYSASGFTTSSCIS